jgi:GTP-binding protein
MQNLRFQFISSSPSLVRCPKPDKPEFAVIGRSNVGKSSLINMLAGRKGLAKISSTPGKTRLINHFLVNDQWFLVDLPGYGFAKLSKAERERIDRMINTYLLGRTNLICTFLLIDPRHEPLKTDLDFISWMGREQIFFTILFTKCDKLSKGEIKRIMELYRRKLLESWEEPPLILPTSVKTRTGRDELLKIIDSYLQA